MYSEKTIKIEEPLWKDDIKLIKIIRTLCCYPLDETSFFVLYGIALERGISLVLKKNGINVFRKFFSYRNISQDCFCLSYIFKDDEILNFLSSIGWDKEYLFYVDLVFNNAKHVSERNFSKNYNDEKIQHGYIPKDYNHKFDVVLMERYTYFSTLQFLKKMLYPLFTFVAINQDPTNNKNINSFSDIDFINYFKDIRETNINEEWYLKELSKVKL